MSHPPLGMCESLCGTYLDSGHIKKNDQVSCDISENAGRSDLE